MAIPSPRAGVMKPPWPLYFVGVAFGGLVLFFLAVILILASILSLSTIRSTDHLGQASLVMSSCPNQTGVRFRSEGAPEKGSRAISMGEFGSESQVLIGIAPPLAVPFDMSNGLALRPATSSDRLQAVAMSPISSFIYGDEEMEAAEAIGTESDVHSDALAPSGISSAVASPPSLPSSKFEKDELRSCDLYHGKWIYDPLGPLYTNSTCPILIQSQNCQGNGRPDKDYENWRWRPDQCDLPRFDGRKFLELMREKNLAFVGDSLARNHMESLICSLWQVETPRRRKKRWYFKSTKTNIFRIWSAWLARKTTDPLPSTPPDLDKIHLDVPDPTFMEYLPRFDVVVLSSGHWFSKPSAYLLKGSVVGGQLWRPKKPRKKPVDSVKAYGIAMKTMLTAIATHPNYTGLTIIRSYSPDHYTGGAWNTGGFCGRMSRPASTIVRNEHTEVMYKKQVMEYEGAVKKVSNGSKMRLMDITEVFGYRHDGHPGPYYMARRRDPDGRPLSEDCVHWCMPGPVDVWNEILLEVIRRDV